MYLHIEAYICQAGEEEFVFTIAGPTTAGLLATDFNNFIDGVYMLFVAHDDND